MVATSGNLEAVGLFKGLRRREADGRAAPNCSNSRSRPSNIIPWEQCFRPVAKNYQQFGVRWSRFFSNQVPYVWRSTPVTQSLIVNSTQNATCVGVCNFRKVLGWRNRMCLVRNRTRMINGRPEREMMRSIKEGRYRRSSVWERSSCHQRRELYIPHLLDTWPRGTMAGNFSILVCNLDVSPVIRLNPVHENTRRNERRN